MAIRGFQIERDVHTVSDTVSLDESQRAAVNLADGASAAVSGAPGSGKTTTVVELVADRILHREYNPGEVLVLAPNRRAAARLRDRLALRIGVPTPGPLARTLSSVAFSIVGARAALEGYDAPRLLTGAEQDTVLAEMLAGHELDGTGPAWPDPLVADVRRLKGFRTELRELMMRTVEAGLRPESLAGLGRAHGREEWVAAARFIDEYERVVDSFGTQYLDSAELIAQATAELRRGFGLEGIRLVVVDDLQEQGSSALTLLGVLARRGVSVAAFGDPDVAATTFRGSDPAALGSLGATLGVPVTALTLSTVYRHGPGLRTVVQQITSRVGAAGTVVHRSAAAAATEGVDVDEAVIPPVLRVEATSTAAEYQALARVLREHHLFGDIPWRRMAIIVRSGATIPQLSRSLALSEVPTSTPAGGRNIRSEFASGQLIDAVALALGRMQPDADLLTRLITGPLCGLDPVALRRVRLALRHEEIAGGGNRSGDDLLIDAVAQPGRFATIDSAAARAVGRFATTLAQATSEGAAGASVEELFWLFWERSGLAASWSAQALGSGLAADEANRHLDSVMALFTAAKRFVERNPAEPAGRFIDEVLASEVPEDSLTPQAASDAVFIGTPSGVVGAEFDVVVVAGLQDGAWPNPQVRGTLLYPQQLSQVAAGLPVADLDARAEVMSDELRMFALAVSRARHQVVLSAVVNDDEQPSAFLRFPAIRASEVRRTADARHPLSLRGMVGVLRRRLVTTGDAGAAEALARLAAEGVPGADPREWYGLLDPSTTEPLVDLTDPDARVSVSPSKLETFEKSPLAWFIDTMAAAPSGLAAGIGTVVHAAMEHAGHIPAGELTPADVSVEALWQQIDAHWSELYFESPWLAERQRRTTHQLVEGLSQYLTNFLAAGSETISAEGTFAVELGQVTLSGKIDRVERMPNGEVVIVDLKTGKNAPTKSQVADNPQLGGYQLALAANAIEGTSADDASGGAALLYVSGGARGKSYKVLAQQAMTDEQRADFAERVVAAGTGMAAAEFVGVQDLDERDPKAGFMYRIHLVAAVSA
ncbi:superfamily I DNA/RNA helicase/RecB family exonuclease [Okibacterium sp. HSC-33S16]|uniref:UrvD/REP family ATP-dependent DNA helicase n=1 Tax=Okibacterium sp. HSC-33S16 TaxID=2910965 RepID=UPI00209F39FA|nr:UrvD/REP family ATP-dependent DNA helicase [Okibacterium sp. HSC-33S16]MCP2030425.1 superfamily I DNA/RNA helicase/RecB family exonuclease [Okibacterium sp. HSC-33S16]